MSDANIGWSSTIKLHNGTTLIELAEVDSVTVPDDQADEVEVTHYKSPDRRKEYISGLIDGGELEIQMNYIAGTATDLLLTAAKAAGDVRPWEVTIPNGGSGWKFSGAGFVKSYTKDIPVDDVMKATATIRVSGAVTETAASGSGS